MSITPKRIVWAGPAGYEVSLMEEELFMTPGQGGLEESEFVQLVQVFTAAQEARDLDLCPAPRKPNVEEYAQWRREDQAKFVVRKVRQAIMGGEGPF